MFLRISEGVLTDEITKRNGDQAKADKVRVKICETWDTKAAAWSQFNSGVTGYGLFRG